MNTPTYSYGTLKHSHELFGGKMSDETAKAILQFADKEIVLNILFPERHISVFPRDIFAFVNLVYLNLRGNRIAVLPRAIGQLQCLEVAHLNDNELTRLPSTLAMCKKLNFLSLDYNDLYWVPPSILPLQSKFDITLMANHRLLARFNYTCTDVAYWYRSTIDAAVTLLLLQQRRGKIVNGKIPKDVSKYVLVPLVWASRELERWTIMK